MDARASSGSTQIVEGIGQPCSTGSAGAAPLEAIDVAGIWPEFNGEAPLSPVNAGALRERAVRVSSNSVHTAIETFYHSGGRLSPVS